MAFSSNNDSKRLAEINVTPLVDVMLVLMIIFLVTAPLMKYSVEIAIPKTTQENLKKYNQPVNLLIDKNGNLYWNDKLLTKEEFKKNMANFDKENVLQIVADKKTQYQFIADILIAAKSYQINNIGFLIEEER